MKILVEKAVIEQALEALVVAEEFVDRHSEDWYISGQKDLKQIREAITALREALEQPDEIDWIETNKALAKEIIELQKQAEQEPVAWYGKSKTGNILLSVNCVDEDWKPLYAASVKHVQQEPVGEVDIHMDFLRINWKDGRHPPKGTKLYTHPVRTKDLTDNEIDMVLALVGSDAPFHTKYRAVIAAYREKNK